MANVNQIKASFDPRSATDPADLAKQATKAWMDQAASSGVAARDIAGPDSIHVVEANGKLFSLNLRGDQVEAHELNVSRL